MIKAALWIALVLYMGWWCFGMYQDHQMQVTVRQQVESEAAYSQQWSEVQAIMTEQHFEPLSRTVTTGSNNVMVGYDTATALSGSDDPCIGSFSGANRSLKEKK